MQCVELKYTYAEYVYVSTQTLEYVGKGRADWLRNENGELFQAVYTPETMFQFNNRVSLYDQERRMSRTMTYRF